ncbi:MAG: substrate-binding domain-containing protein [Planctomycetes bacterium]|nr:substrate-binding domain-containing protein [Planctomycetota bacterium]
MPTFRQLLLASTLGFAACGHEALLVDPTGTMRVVADLRLPADREVVQARSGGATVVAFDADAAANLQTSTSPPSLRITFGAAPAPDAKLDREIRIVDDTGATVAVELALLHIAGVALPERLPLGTRTHAPTDARGTPRVGPGDLVVAMLRAQNAAALNPRPEVDVLFLVGFVRDGDDAWRQRCEREVRTAVNGFAQLQMHVRQAGPAEADVTRAIGELLDAGCRAIVTSVGDPAVLAASRSRCDDAKVALVALDPLLRPGATCCVGADQDVLGRTAAERLRAAVPAGSEIVLVRSTGDALADLRATGFAAALGLKPL